MHWHLDIVADTWLDIYHMDMFGNYIDKQAIIRV